MKVLKFGGSSVADPERIRSVAAIVLAAARRDRIVVVVSAFQGVTNQLLQCAHLAEKGGANYQKLFAQIAEKHRSAINALLKKQNRRQTLAVLDERLKELEDVLHGMSLLRDCPPQRVGSRRELR